MPLGNHETPIFRSWGGLAAEAAMLSPDDWRKENLRVLPYGNGRSYGDSCLNAGGGQIAMRAANRLLAFDRETGLLVAEAGMLLSQAIEIVLPQGWFLPVTPGTRFVTLGGALANDVHGKNHHGAGTFGRHVPWFDLARSDGTVLRCSADDNAGLYAATIGGLGLTGLITRLAVQMIPVASSDMLVRTTPFPDLDAFFAIAAETDSNNAYSVAWIDSLAIGKALGRGVHFAADHASDGEFAPDRAQARLGIPFTPPFSLLNRLSIGLFNRAYAFSKRRDQTARAPLGPFFYPLDGVRDWNRLYGPGGLRQFQCVVPRPIAKEAIRALIEATHRAGAASFLTVLKLFGDVSSPGLLSFPVKGATLTLDFPYRGKPTEVLLKELERLTMAAGGRINPYKDATMSKESFAAGYPRLEAFRAFLDPAFSSDFSRRIGIG
jgi:FAD/FMN-containing dehydrogenase